MGKVGGKSSFRLNDDDLVYLVLIRFEFTFYLYFTAVYKNCAEVYKSGDKISGVYKIDPDGLGEFEVFCDQTTAGGGWTVFQKRYNGTVDFFRAWDDYKQGFGNLNSEFWLGLETIRRLTACSSNKLRVDLEDFCRVRFIFCCKRKGEIPTGFGSLFR